MPVVGTYTFRMVMSFSCLVPLINLKWSFLSFLSSFGLKHILSGISTVIPACFLHLFFFKWVFHHFAVSSICLLWWGACLGRNRQLLLFCPVYESTPSHWEVEFWYSGLLLEGIWFLPCCWFCRIWFFPLPFCLPMALAWFMVSCGLMNGFIFLFTLKHSLKYYLQSWFSDHKFL